VLAKPTIQYVVEEALDAGADEVIIVSNRQKQSIEEHFTANETLVSLLEATDKTDFANEVRRSGELPVSFVEQSEALGLGHAVMMASPKVLGDKDGDANCAGAGGASCFATDDASRVNAGDANCVSAGAANHAGADCTNREPFYVLLGDVIVPDNTILPRMLSISKTHDQASVIAVFKVPHEQVHRFGVISGHPLAAGGDVWQVTGLVEKPPIDEAPSDLAIFGRYLLSPCIMELLAKTAPGAGGEIQLTDAMIALLKHEQMYALVIDETEGFDVGTIESWLTTNIALAMRDEALALAIKECL
jgi:UTP--glucose-1-phosphate uridylyltransferase